MRKKLIAEFIGTYFLVFAGTGAIVINEITKSLTHIGIALTFGLVVMALIYTFGHISGAHFNPAVSIGFVVNGDISVLECLFYIISQLLGALSASATLYALFGNIAKLGSTLPKFSWQQSFVLELILTFALMMVIFGSAVHGKAVKSFAGIAIGATVGLEAMFAGPICGASMNPARSIAPALVSRHLDHLWIYIVATILGAVLASLVYKTIHE
ncbi:MIP/aquaporin family protein [Bacillus methanolicus]|uniref:MIP family channel protein n=1 Tax=Bacillus methanolicus (strain MGA3 / ATCC 53907) TaxID=796606 RepID=I3E878_BACMM|nr:MIP family channel protein [Bacillus methanolicus]AIE59974.1 MIP family channel protein [Bacillus methanolicus MGA3]EIJ82699.1 MIP family channel protein [Bacillus methanolicus MGA3]